MKPLVRPAVAALALAFVPAAGAQSMKAYEDRDVGVRMSIPSNWTWDSRSRDVFVNCAPEKEDRGRPGCYFTLAQNKVPADQAAISDADRQKWKGWSTADGRRPMVSSGDMKVAGMPAYEVVVRMGPQPDATTTRDVFVLVPKSGRMIRASFSVILDPADYQRYNPAFSKALETLKPIP